MDIMFLTSIMVKIIFVVAVGFILKRTGVITDELQKGLSGLLVNGIVPFNILEASVCEYSEELAVNVGYSAVIAGAYYLLVIIFGHLLVRRFKLDKNSKRIIITMITFANVGFIGFSLTGELFGEEGTLYCVIYNLFYNALMYVYGINLLSGEKGFNLKAAFKKPVTVACIIALIIFFSPFHIPDMLLSPISSIGSMVFPVSMIIIGCEINEMELSMLIKNKYAYVVSALRLLILPLIMAAVLHLLGFRGILPRTMVVLTALPCGSMNIIFAEAYDCAPKLAAVTVVQSMLLLIPTLPIIIAVCFALL
ncbi:MAG: AEC family transporter [Eubacterium sp.]|nr:AEC family transporter [Eubacterium sp.]